MSEGQSDKHSTAMREMAEEQLKSPEFRKKLLKVLSLSQASEICDLALDGIAARFAAIVPECGSSATISEGQLCERLRPAVSQIFDHFDELSRGQALQILVDALRDLDAPAGAAPSASATPFDNCRYEVCDLPGQCVGEGRCHHPRAAPVSATRTLTDAECNAKLAKLEADTAPGLLLGVLKGELLSAWLGWSPFRSTSGFPTRFASQGGEFPGWCKHCNKHRSLHRDHPGAKDGDPEWCVTPVSATQPSKVEPWWCVCPAACDVHPSATSATQDTPK